MKNDIIKICYDVDETGPAEHLGGRLACIAEPPLLTEEVFVGDIVQLCHDPDEDDGIPCIEEVVYSRFPCRTRLEYVHEQELAILRSLLSIVGAECYSLIPPNGRRGLAIVGHCEHVDPELLAEAVGIPQMLDQESLGVEERRAIAR